VYYAVERAPVRHGPCHCTRLMLRIARVEKSGSGCVLRLEGHVIGPWVEELRRSCEDALATCSFVVLDLSGVSFIDRPGIPLLLRLRDRGVTLVNCSGFVSALLEGSRP
jgi:anti-anti-sigma regulatory factor